MKKLILDARKCNDYGIGEYIKILFPGIIDSGKFETAVLVSKKKEPNPGYYSGIFNSDLIGAVSDNYSPWEHLEIPFRIRGLKDFHFFSPHYIFPGLIRNKLIVTIHDLIHFRFPEYFRPALKVRIAGRFIEKIRRSGSFVFTVSDHSKNDLMELFGFPEERIRVIHNGLPDIFFRFRKGANPKPYPYMMYAGNFKPHKNLETLIGAFGSISAAHPDLRLVLAGIGKSRELSALCGKHRVTDRVVPAGFVSREELINLLDFSEFFVFPSLYEGFGFPPLEAMARGRAVLSTECGSLREILGDSALYFDHRSPEDLRHKTEQLLCDASLRSKYEKSGSERSRNYTVGKMIAGYLDALDQIDP